MISGIYGFVYICLLTCGGNVLKIYADVNKKVINSLFSTWKKLHSTNTVADGELNCKFTK